MEESKNENSCGCGTNENSSCCTPKSFNKRMWTTIIFVVVILFAGLLISYKMFCPMACKGDGACAKDSVASCCADKNMQKIQVQFLRVVQVKTKKIVQLHSSRIFLKNKK